jgi:cell division transport system permease protein
MIAALRYFLREAFVGLVRSWRVSLLAVLTIGVSVFLAGLVLLVSQNLSSSIDRWRREARLVVYLDPQIEDADREAVERALRDAPWTSAVAAVPAEESTRRFRSAFPSLSELVADARYGSLPESLEAELRSATTEEEPSFRDWTRQLAALPGVEIVDDDRDWIEDVEALLALVQGIGTLLTGVLLGAAVFTIAAVVRLTSFLYRDEIAVMRLVGATEFYIRGPFYAEGILQGLFGAAAALGALGAAYLSLSARFDSSLVLTIVASDFLSSTEIVSLVLFGGTAGLAGALVSLGRERPASERT